MSDVRFTKGPNSDVTPVEQAMIERHLTEHSSKNSGYKGRHLADYFESSIMRKIDPSKLDVVHCHGILTRGDCKEVLRLLARGGNESEDPQRVLDFIADTLRQHATFGAFAKDPESESLRRDGCGPGIAYAFVARDRLKSCNSKSESLSTLPVAPST